VSLELPDLDLGAGYRLTTNYSYFARASGAPNVAEYNRGCPYIGSGFVVDQHERIVLDVGCDGVGERARAIWPCRPGKRNPFTGEHVVERRGGVRQGRLDLGVPMYG
jgi:hypothetical protein